MSVFDEVFRSLLARPDAEAERRRLTAVAFVVRSPDGRDMGRYDLDKPVPFGEGPPAGDYTIKISGSSMESDWGAVNDAGEMLTCHHSPQILSDGNTLTITWPEGWPLMRLVGEGM